MSVSAQSYGGHAGRWQRTSREAAPAPHFMTSWQASHPACRAIANSRVCQANAGSTHGAAGPKGQTASLGPSSPGFMAGSSSRQRQRQRHSQHAAGAAPPAAALWCGALLLLAAASPGMGAPRAALHQPRRRALSAQQQQQQQQQQPLPPPPVINTGEHEGGVTLLVGLRGRADAALERRLRETYTPGSRNYLRFLTPQQYGAQYGPTDDAIATVTACFIDGTDWINREAGASRLFHVFGFNDYAQAADYWERCARAHANLLHLAALRAGDASAAASAAQQRGGEGGVSAAAAAAASTGGSQPGAPPARSPGHVLAPGGGGGRRRLAYSAGDRDRYLTADKLRKMYGLPSLSEFDGRGINVHVATYQRVQESDLVQYAKLNGLPRPSTIGLYDPLTPNYATDDPTETVVNLELVLAAAPRARLRYSIGENTDMGEVYMLNAIANNERDGGRPATLPPVVLYTWSREEQPGDADGFVALLLKQMALQGQTVITASGNCGSAAQSGNGSCLPGGPAVGFPQNLPHACAVGGSAPSLFTSGTIAQEGAWRLSGGGASAYVAAPTYQAGIPAAALPRPGKRALPDVALAADPDRYPYEFVRFQPGLTGGTTAAASVWAGFAALITQCRRARGLPRLGLLNHHLYQATASAAWARGMRDIQQGSNGAYAAGPGWDAATGWGSLDGQQLMGLLCPGYVGTCCKLGGWSPTCSCFESTNGTCTVERGRFHINSTSCSSRRGSPAVCCA